MTWTTRTVGALLVVLVLVVVLVRACGGDRPTRAGSSGTSSAAADQDQDQSTDLTPHVDDTAATSEGATATSPPPSEIPSDADTEEASNDPTEVETYEGLGGSETDDDHDPASGGTNADEEPDPATLAFLRAGLWNSTDDTNPRCRRPSTTGGQRVDVQYQDAADRGDFYLVCFESQDPPAFPLSLVVTDPTGSTRTTTDLRPADQTATFGLGVDDRPPEEFFPVTASTRTGSRRHVGLWLAEDQHLVQVHLWMPHDRRPGTWSLRLGNHVADFDVDDICGGDDAKGSDPLGWPLDIDFAVGDYGDDLDEHCLAWPNLVGTDADGSVDAVAKVLDARAVLDTRRALDHGRDPATEVVQDDSTVRLDQQCGDEPAGTVVEQSPPVHELDGIRRASDVLLRVSTGPCASPPTHEPAPPDGTLAPSTESSATSEAREPSEQSEASGE